MADENQVPEHRTAVTPRSGDTHVIGDDGEAVNVDQQERDLAAAEAAKTQRKEGAKKPAAPTDETGKIDPVT